MLKTIEGIYRKGKVELAERPEGAGEEIAVLVMFLEPPRSTSGFTGSTRRTASSFRKEILAAKPGSHLFTPHPYPHTDQEVFEDFVATYSAIWQNTPEPAMPAEVRQLFVALKSGSVIHKISTIEDWGYQRCLLLSPARFHYLVQLYDRKTGAEFARATVKETGLWSSFQAPPPNTPADAVKLFQTEVEALDHAVATAAAYGLRGAEAPQYVETAGTLRCPQIAPCVAFRVGKSILISKRGQLFEVAPDCRQLPRRNFPAPLRVGTRYSLGSTRRASEWCH